ncbi:U11/U12 small nuclear ribonucleoprotein 59 kDa protein [Ricinus communis]|uniref:U11/U12 small nuclear ribonucleoprotein 59 kDa protein n=1 Tax=Ricinus communis TaxID=3988 RepID=UPI00201A523A|nr:U11/U12 small nuclear ribonucleoprotein 59 kDa protein [Ricinus communis]XP_015582579.2 U11/U12 small nuclear ribonucleoprotein 59 kDa protein [Ricinus communis]
MNSAPFHSYSGAPAAPPSNPWLPILPPDPPQSSAFWETKNVHDRFSELQDTLILAKAMQKELEALMTLRDAKGSVEHGERGSIDPVTSSFSDYLKQRNIDFEAQESLSLDAANSLMSKLRAQLEPFRSLVDEASPWEEKSALVRLHEKMLKSKRNKLWRKRKRKRVAEMRAKKPEQFDQADREADECRAREIAKDAAQLKMAKMKEIAKLKAKEERKRLESELELVLMVEKLQELRSIRIQKLKKQGHFLPKEDDEFLERVRAAVEEEERQAVAAADTDAAKGAIATAEESRKAIQSLAPISKNSSANNGETKESKSKVTESKDSVDSVVVTGPSEERAEGQSYSGAYDSVANLPVEFYHYYHGSNNDMGTLIEVRRTWDAYIRPGGSRIPGHWVQPPPPANEIWASYLVRHQ